MEFTGDTYSVGANEQFDGRRADMTYYRSRSLRATLHLSLSKYRTKWTTHICRAIRYCLNIFDGTKVLPLSVVINTDGFSSKKLRDAALDKSARNPFYAHPCQSCAKQVPDIQCRFPLRNTLTAPY
ncbi:uncharacterized protein BYT42DRAFT_495721 [Radiomyces spectabilis]|uniref:uncharacterized protein n=1 Tax=Radiomyces spectabilis TaxID=64574 RepID=UPI00221FA4F1|nr:uncharacterized protein BYT42DRAFT_495721 [Radiomyces spectabilis]KAI8379370.1 hypothetical protein BYT42DRAFT_495721 [Radiomyces spectabilis]